MLIIYIFVCACVSHSRVHAYAPLASSLFPQFARKKSFPVTDVPSRGAVIVCHQLNFACTLPYCTVRVQRKEKVCVCVCERERGRRERESEYKVCVAVLDIAASSQNILAITVQMQYS